tara:strand:+ start:2119 stop:2475 length:357 start_codon:yes stop_codon:yes gene_type:complete
MLDSTSYNINKFDSTGITGNNTCRESPIAVKELLELVDNTWHYNLSFESHLINILENPENEVKILDTCNCCERHKINRPKSLQPWINTPYQNCGETDYPCKCNCRHVSRFICRAFRPN